jgi:hypothetical protein
MSISNLPQFLAKNAKDKHSSLFQRSISNWEKQFISTLKPGLDFSFSVDSLSPTLQPLQLSSQSGQQRGDYEILLGKKPALSIIKLFISVMYEC